MSKLPIALILAGILLAGCEDVPDDETTDELANTAEDLADQLANDDYDGSDDDGGDTSGDVPAGGWTWDDGKGFSAPSAVRDDSVTLTMGSVNSSGISYSHTGYSHWSDANAIAALVYPDGTRRKFEWAPTSRTYRGWENVYHGYGGMPLPSSGDAMGFQLFSIDGKYCSNTLYFSWP
jgi:hypothetical protein